MFPSRRRHALIGLVASRRRDDGPALADAGAVWAWVTVRNAHGDSLVSGPKDAGSWNNGGAGVHRVGTGHYQVTFYGAQENGSGADVALVSPMGSTARTCAVVGWERVTSSEVVEVKCQTLGGTADRQPVRRPLARRERRGWAARVRLQLEPHQQWRAARTRRTTRAGGPIVVHPDNQTAQLRFGSQGVDGGVAIVSATDRDRVIDGSFPTSCSLARLTTVLDPHNVSNPERRHPRQVRRRQVLGDRRRRQHLSRARGRVHEGSRPQGRGAPEGRLPLGAQADHRVLHALDARPLQLVRRPHHACGAWAPAGTR